MRLFPSEPPPGPSRPGFWRSPLRGAWLTSLIGVLLLPGLFVVAATGLISHAAYQPDLAHNAIVPPGADFQPFIFPWPTHPAWLYAATQGTHVTVGFTLVPLVLAKLWSVLPRLFDWPPIRNVGHALERLTLLGVVGGVLFEFATGILNTQLYYPFGFGFVRAHYFGAWVVIVSVTLHVVIKIPVIRRAYRLHGVLTPLSRSLAETLPEAFEPGGLASPDPAEPTISRRGLLGLSAVASGALFVISAGQSIGGPLRSLALLALHGTSGRGPNGFQINTSAATAGIRPEELANWALELRGPTPRTMGRSELLALPQTTDSLPIACVEGWSTTQAWTGIRLRDLAAMAGVPGATRLTVTSLQKHGILREVTLTEAEIHDDRSLLALRVNGVDLSLDHGFPARIIVPALPGVHNTKWVASLEFRT